MLRTEINWTNSSVRELSAGENPVDKIVSIVRNIILESSDYGISGPPYDPFELAKFMGIDTLPRHDVSDARTISLSKNKFLIEYNPNKSKGRIKFSIAHELAHTLFPDCAKEIRNRGNLGRVQRDSWQLEMLCNIGASEFLMPIGSFPDLSEEDISIGNFLNLQNKYDVSTEALFLRAVKLTKAPCFIFCATRLDSDDLESNYAIDYIVSSKTWGLDLPKNLILPQESFVRKCTAVGYKLISDETWDDRLGKFHVECVGIPPYPSHRYPRVLGIVTKPRIKKKSINTIKYLFGDATQPQTDSAFIIAHVVNDKAQRWGGRGFAKYLKKKWPAAEKEFIGWKKSNASMAILGKAHRFDLDDERQIMSMVAQKGYGPSFGPRIRYGALKACLQEVAKESKRNNSSVHMPRIGCGEAGGSWNVVSELIEDELCSHGVSVYVYDLPPSGNLQG